MSVAAPQAGVEEDRFVVFRLAGETFAVPVGSVREVVDATTVTPVPRAPSCVEGIVNLRGNVVPVVHLGRRLGMKTDGESRCVVVVEWEGEVVGLLVDQVIAVLRLADIQTEGWRTGTEEATDAFVAAVARQEGDRLISVLDLSRLLDLRGR